MLRWLLALASGAALAGLQYFVRRGEPSRRALLPPALLRAAALTLLVALLLDAPPPGSARETTAQPLVAVDVSASWRRGDTTRWQLLAGRVRALGPDSLLLFGDSVRSGPLPAAPNDGASRAAALVERTRAANRPLVVLTDGLLDDAPLLRSLVLGSRVEVIGATRPAPDAALSSLDAPRAALTGDTIVVTVGIVAGANGSAPGTLAATADDTPLASAVVGAIGPWGERSVTVRGVLRAPARGAPGGGERRDIVLRVALRTSGDAESRNDTLAVVLELAPAAGAVVVSTSPDHHVRFAVEMLRGTLAMPVRAFLLVAPGQWREQQRGSLARVDEAAVRAAVARAPLVMLHGDTAIFGAPSRLTAAPRVLMTPAQEQEAAADWFAQAAPGVSPLSAPLAGVEWDTLPPVEPAPGAAPAPDITWTALVARRARRGEPLPIVAGRDGPGLSRAVILSGSGFWRWRFRGGHAADAFAALWGGIFDWLAEARGDTRTAMPAEALLRAGEPIGWRRRPARGGEGDSVTSIRLVRRSSAAGGGDSVTLRWPRGASMTTSRPLAEGVYEARGAGGTRLVVVNPSREWLPRRPSVESGAVGRMPAARERGRGLREASWFWPYALVLALLCAEWIWRRRIGLR